MRFLVLLACLAGCYSPSGRDCTVACGSPNDCLGGQVCNGEGWCTAPDTVCGMAAPDAAMATTDATPADARPLCELGCPNGTCVAGVCVIDCSATDTCSNDVTCPPNIPCRVLCGDRSCDHKVICGLASTCEVQCTGTDSCADEVHCGKTPCDVTCSGANSCKRRVKCKEACSCDVECTGTSSCMEVAECPLMDACKLGRGCSSELAGCDRCE